MLTVSVLRKQTIDVNQCQIDEKIRFESKSFPSKNCGLAGIQISWLFNLHNFAVSEENLSTDSKKMNYGCNHRRFQNPSSKSKLKFEIINIRTLQIKVMTVKLQHEHEREPLRHRLLSASMPVLNSSLTVRCHTSCWRWWWIHLFGPMNHKQVVHLLGFIYYPLVCLCFRYSVFVTVKILFKI